MIPLTTNTPDAFDGHSDESGQALVELLLVIIVCFIFGFGIYETGALYHNISVMNKALNSATQYASQGAPISELERVITKEAQNLLSTAFIAQSVASDPGLVVKVKNPETGKRLGAWTNGGHTFRTQCTESLSPKKKNVTPYMFWANGYEIQLAIRYSIGIYLPFLKALSVDTVIEDSRTIAERNDLDQDGMVDSREAEYVDWAMAKKAVVAGTEWINPVHRDEYNRVDSADPDSTDIDGDGTVASSDTQPYDYDNDGLADKYDKAERTDQDNKLTMNPLIGPGADPSSNDNKWIGGDCPY